jgi:Transposase DDE domain
VRRRGLTAQASRLCDLHHARYRGLAKTHLQHVLTALAINLVRVDACSPEPPGPEAGPPDPPDWPNPYQILEPARSAPPATSRRRATLAAAARLAAEVAGLLLVELLGNPRASAAALDLARSLTRWLADRRPPTRVRAHVTTRQVTVVRAAGTGVLVQRVEAALVVRTRAWPAHDVPRPLSKGHSGNRASS